MRTQVGIIGAGPAGLLLSHLLHLQGIESVVLEARSREHIENRIRAGVLEHTTAQLLRDAGLGERMDREGLPHNGTILRFDGRDHRIDFWALTGKRVMVYSQHELVRDLILARLKSGGPIAFEASDVAVHDIDGDSPRITYVECGMEHTLRCDVIVGADGFHGICRPSLPEGVLTAYDRIYPFAWLGILAETPPSSEELVYANHPNGFALLSMRSPAVSRLYLQCAADEDPDGWSDDRIWTELRLRLSRHDGFELKTGRIFQKGVTPMRSFVAEPMQADRLFLAGDAAHIVPPTGAKGLNLAAADAAVLSRALGAFFAHNRTDLLAAYSATCLRRVWKVQRFSWWMTTLFHRFDSHTGFDRKVQLAELDYIASSEAASRALAENYVGLPLFN